jgi:type IX secretion system PorP/SprF family membrane protein
MRLNFNKIGLAVAGVLLFGQAVQAQQLPVMNHYIYNPYLYNPARAGQNEQGTVSLNFKKQWVAMPNSPITGALLMESPINGTRLGVGGMIYSDKTHIVNKVGGLATVAYHLPFDKTGAHGMSGGLSLGVLNQRLAVSEATVANPNDPQLVGPSTTGTTMDLSLGLNYHWKALQVGVSMLQGLGNSVKYLNTANGTNSDYTLSRHFLFSANYNFDIGAKKDFAIAPTLLLRVVPAIPVQAELNVLANWRKMIYLGMGFRSGNAQMTTSAMMTTLGVSIKERVFFAYTIDYGVSNSLNASLGTQHEFMVSFKFGKDKELERKVIDMSAQIEESKRKDEELEKRMVETNGRVDSLVINQNNLTENQAKLAENQAKLAVENEVVRKKLAEQAAENAEQNAKLTQHDKELEEIRKRLDARTSEFKRLGSVTFDEGKAGLTDISKSELDAVIPTLKKDPKIRVYLYGRASTKGSRTANEQLSMKRAVSVRQYLIVVGGISGNNIEVIPVGATDPENGTNKDNANDRRVDIYIK